MENTTDQPTVLVMDDDEDVRFIAAIMLKRIGFNVDFAENGQEAVDMYRSGLHAGTRYHAVILDLNVPGGMGGEEAVRLLKEIDPDVAAYVSCGNPFDPAMDDPAGHGFRGAIAKPFLPEHLHILLEQ
ncbi:response regulator receiver protein [Geobacter sp. OR-1]|uniref:response regulator n=1 Tax=Geobacter sp. OR-1 TaxID=1266765 RepID=UPI000543429B|nr:response regulator [Geobacter sp. OR-1]GAM07779.1 response regulator receiver protein [Geobacter sp. OR-1]